MTKEKNKLTSVQVEEIIRILKNRFEKNINFHKKIQWDKVQKRLEQNKYKLWSIQQMEATGGEPDIVDYDSKTDEYIFYDCSIESPKGRRSLCYDKEALISRKENKPQNNIIDMANDMGVDILTVEQYKRLQELGNFDMKTSSWVKTPDCIRKLGGAIFCDNRYNTIFVYHNSAESYYSSRGFRASIRI